MERIKFALLLLLITMWGCASPMAEKATVTQQFSYPTKEYRIQPGDQLDIKLFYNPELNEALTVRPDGKITLQLVNDVMAAGRTPAELTAILTKAYSADLANPKVAVIVRTSVSDKVYVDGEVNRAGLVTLTGPITALQSIAQAGGMKETAKSNQVLIIRKGDDNKINVIEVNLAKALNGSDVSQDIILKPNDIVYVPRTTIANIDIWVDQYIRKIIPLPIGLGYTL